MVRINTVSSLEKVFPYDELKQFENNGSCFENERYNFQVVVNSDLNVFDLRFKIESDILDFISVRTVELIPSRFAKYPLPPHNEGYYLNHGNNELYPDLLRPMHENGGEFLRYKQNVAYWFTVDGSSKLLPVGKHEIKILAYDFKDVYHGEKEPELLGEVVYTLEVLKGELPPLSVVNTCWLHYDCICDKHGVEPFTNAFYDILDKYVTSVVTHGQNMLYIPAFTPPLDTAKGTYRKTIQLIDVTVNDGKYEFDFTKFIKFIKFVLNRGIKWLELSHIATQWGAKYCPKIMATVNGEYTQIFGWDTSSTSKEYGEFLNEYYKNLKVVLTENSWENLAYFHISDEPSGEVKENFIFIKNVIKKYFPNAKCMDALSDKSLYDDGIITHPVVGLHHYENFKSPYVYYCGSICEYDITNRHFAMPSDRTRILGLQLFRNDSKMFLQWAVNFYYSVLSYYEVDPYFISDANFFFVSGDSYVVYPTSGGVYDSLRHETLCEAWQDHRALSLLAEKIGKDAVLNLLDEEGVKIGFTNYPHDPIWFKKFREKVNQMIANN